MYSLNKDLKFEKKKKKKKKKMSTGERVTLAFNC